MPLPIFSALTLASSLSVNASFTSFITSIRLVPVQAWPLNDNPPLIARLTA